MTLSYVSRKILINTDINRKIELLESGRIDRTNLEIIKEFAKIDNGYNENAGKIEELIQTNEKRLSKSEQSKLATSNTQDKKIMALYSKYILNFYNDKSQENGESKNYSELKKVNDKMLEYLKLKDSKVENDIEMSFSDMKLIEANYFGESDIEELRSNKSAMRKLAYIFGSGEYSSSGEKIKLTESQQMGLAKLLARVNERDLKAIKTSKPSDIAKQLKTTVEKQTDGAQNSL